MLLRLPRLPSVFSLKVAAVLVALAFSIGAAGGGWLAHELAQAKALRKEFAMQEAWTKAVNAAREKERAQAQKDFDTAYDQLRAQKRIEYRYVTLNKEVPTYVTPAQDARGCVTYGLVRLLDAAALGRSPSDLDLPAGTTDDACSPLAPSALARGLLDNYAVAQQNAEQLDALIANVKERTDTHNAK